MLNLILSSARMTKASVLIIITIVFLVTIASTILDFVPHYLVSTFILSCILFLTWANKGLLSFPLVMYGIIFLPAFTPFYAWDLRGKNYFSHSAVELQGSIALINGTVWVFAIAAIAYYATTLTKLKTDPAPGPGSVFAVGKVPAILLGCLLVVSAFVVDPGPTILTASYSEILAGRFNTSQGTVFFGLVMGGSFVSLFLFARHHRWIFWVSTLIAFTWLFLHVRRVELFGLILVLLFWMRASLKPYVTMAILVVLVGFLGIMGEVRNKGIFANNHLAEPIRDKKKIASAVLQDGSHLVTLAAFEDENRPVEKVANKVTEEELQVGEIRIALGGQHIEIFEFADGSVKTLDELISGSRSNTISRAPTGRKKISTVGFNKIKGTSGNDTLVGTDGDDFIRGLGGTDNIDGGEGDDILDAGGSTKGWQFLSGGDGNDTYLYGTWHGMVYIPGDAETSNSGAIDKVVFKDLNSYQLTIGYHNYGNKSEGNALRLIWNSDFSFTKAALPGGASNIFVSGLHLVNIRVNDLIPSAQMLTMVGWIKGLVPGSIYAAFGIKAAQTEHQAIFEKLNLDYQGGMPLVAVFFLNGGYILVAVFGVLHGFAARLLERIYTRNFLPNLNQGGNFLMFIAMVFLFYQFRYQWYNPQSPIRAMEFGILLYVLIKIVTGLRIFSILNRSPTR